MKKIFLAASLLFLITAGVNAQSSTGKTTKKSAAKTTVQKQAATSTKAASDTTHHKSLAMGSKKHYRRHKTAGAKAK
jgi:hypothetical protein